jgi:hypothetical protein
MNNFGLSTLIQRIAAINAQILVVANNGGLNPNPTPPMVTQYPLVNGVGPNGNISPTWVIAGTNTTLKAISGVAVHAGLIYVADNVANSITVFPLAMGGNLTPTFRIAGNNTAIFEPSAIACDSSGNIFVGASNQVTVYEAGAQGNVAPKRTISGANTRLGSVIGIAVDSSGQIYVLNSIPEPGSINIYPAGASGNVAPVAIIEGPQTELGLPQGLALDSAGKIYVTNDPIYDPNCVLTYPPAASGNVAPSAIIKSGPTTGLYVQGAITIASGDKIYVVNGQWATAVSVFPAGANGSIPPLASLNGSATLIAGAAGVAVGTRSFFSCVTRLFAALLGRPA